MLFSDEPCMACNGSSRATRIDDINFKLKIGTTKETGGGGGKKFNKNGGFKSSKAQSSFDKKRIAAINAGKRDTKSAELEAKVAAVGKDTYKREKRNFIDPTTQAGNDFYVEHSREICTYCKLGH